VQTGESPTSFGRILLSLLALLLVLGFFGYRWAANIEPTAMTAVDRGNFSAEEKCAFSVACTTRVKLDADKTCGCFADKAATEFSRFERLTMTASIEGSPAKMVAIVKGLVDAGVPKDKVEAVRNGSKERITGLMKSCGLTEWPTCSWPSAPSVNMLTSDEAWRVAVNIAKLPTLLSKKKPESPWGWQHKTCLSIN
jgi:hypothetical protein